MLDRLHEATRRDEREDDQKNGGDPFKVSKPPSASKGGVAEIFFKVFEIIESLLNIPSLDLYRVWR